MFSNRRNSSSSMPSGQVGGVCVDVEEGYEHSDSAVSDHRQGRGDAVNISDNIITFHIDQKINLISIFA